MGDKQNSNTEYFIMGGLGLVFLFKSFEKLLIWVQTPKHFWIVAVISFTLI